MNIIKKSYKIEIVIPKSREFYYFLTYIIFYFLTPIIYLYNFIFNELRWIIKEKFFLLNYLFVWLFFSSEIILRIVFTGFSLPHIGWWLIIINTAKWSVNGLMMNFFLIFKFNHFFVILISYSFLELSLFRYFYFKNLIYQFLVFTSFLSG